MSDPIFALTRHEYKSYTDLLELIRLSEFPTCFVDEIDAASSNTYIMPVRNGEAGDGWQGARARIIHWSLEWDAYPPMPGIAEVWSSDKWHAERDGNKYVPMGSHPGLKPNADSLSAETYDVCFIGYINGVHRRERIRQQLIERGVSVSPTGAWGDDRHRILSNSAAYLHVHQHDHAPTIAPLRMVVAAAYGLPVISETAADAGIFGGCTVRLHYSHIAETTPHVLTDTSSMELGARLHQLLCHELTFRKSVEAALP